MEYHRGNVPLVSQNRHAGCEQLDGEADDGLYANSGKLGLDEPAVDRRLTRAGDQSQRRQGARAERSGPQWVVS